MRISWIAALFLGTCAIAESVSYEEDSYLPTEFHVSVEFPGLDTTGKEVELINDQEIEVKLHFINNEPNSLTVAAFGGYFLNKGTAEVYANLTNAKVGPYIVNPGQAAVDTQNIRVSLPPKSFDLVFVIFLAFGNEILPLPIDSIAVSINDPPISFWDPKLLLVQLILGLSAGGLGYYLSTAFIIPYFSGSKNSKTAKSSRTVESSAESSGVKVNSKGYDESWIPEHHLKKSKVKKSS